LNAGLWFRRGRLAMVFSSLAASCCHGAKKPLIPVVQISGTTSACQKPKKLFLQEQPNTHSCKSVYTGSIPVLGSKSFQWVYGFPAPRGRR